MEVDQRVVFGDAGRALAKAHAVEGEHRACAADPVDQRVDDGGLDVDRAQQRGFVQIADELRERIEAVGPRADKGGVELAGIQQPPRDQIEQRDVAARRKRNVQVGLFGGLGASVGRSRRAAADRRRRRRRAPALLDPVERHRMRLDHVRADDEDQVGMIDVVVAGGRAVGAEAGHVSQRGRGHAEPAIGIGVVRAQEAFEQLDREVGRLAVELAAAVESDGVGTVAAHDVEQPLGGESPALGPTWTARKSSPRRARIWGWVNRSGGCCDCGNKAPLAQMPPRLAAASATPFTRSTVPYAASAHSRQPTPQ